MCVHMCVCGVSLDLCHLHAVGQIPTGSLSTALDSPDPARQTATLAGASHLCVL